MGMESGPRFEMGPEPFEAQHSPELTPTSCAVEALKVIQETGLEPDMLTRLLIRSETQSPDGTVTEISCERCGAGCAVTHNNWEIKSLAYPSHGASLSSCPELETYH
jgi:hypothetical protein